MGSLYQDGVGVAKDLGSASYWYGEAAKGGAKDADAARQARERLAGLPKEYQAGPEDVVAFDGGRFVLRRAANKQ
jgi:TPR repeat protein